jgi:hypothetical protein
VGRWTTVGFGTRLPDQDPYVGSPSGTGMGPELVEGSVWRGLCALSLSKGTHLFDSVLPALAVWRRPRWGQGQALRVACGQP